MEQLSHAARVGRKLRARLGKAGECADYAWDQGFMSVSCGLRTIDGTLRTTERSLRIMERRLRTTERRLRTMERRLADNGAETADNGAEAADNGAEAADNGAEAADYGAEAADNGAEAADNRAAVANNGAAVADNGAKLAVYKWLTRRISVLRIRFESLRARNYVLLIKTCCLIQLFLFLYCTHQGFPIEKNACQFCSWLYYWFHSSSFFS